MKSSGKLFRESEGEVEELPRKKNKGRGSYPHFSEVDF
jgi:hypothetical protein